MEEIVSSIQTDHWKTVRIQNHLSYFSKELMSSLVLQSTLLILIIATPAFFWVVFPVRAFFDPFTSNLSVSSYLFIYFGCTCGMWKFLGLGTNPCHSSNSSHCSDNTGSLTNCTARELPGTPTSKTYPPNIWHWELIGYVSTRPKVL